MKMLWKRFRKYRLTYKNYISVILSLRLRREFIYVRLKDGYEDLVDRRFAYALLIYTEKVGQLSSHQFLDLLKRERISYNGQEVILHGMPGNGDFVGVFIEEEYRNLNVKDKVVIDIGANNGDSAIYFALNGARRVIALEPYPHAFFLAERNIMENGLADKIIIVNEGMGKREK